MGRHKKEAKIEVKGDSKIRKAMVEINKTLKIDAIKFASEEPDKEKLAIGIPTLDEMIGGGTQCGNFTVIYGGESVGKSTLVLKQIATAQANGKSCVYIDLEHSFDSVWAKQVGINLEKLILVEKVKTAEEAMDIVVKLANEQLADLIVVDSIQAMSPKEEQETKQGVQKSLEKDEMALLARKLGKFFRVAATPVYKGKVDVILIGQVRTQGIGTFITRDGLSGGHALKHWACMTLYMRRGQKADAPSVTEVIEYEEDGEIKKEKISKIIGFDSVIKIEKTKVSGSKPELSDIHLPFLFSTGYDAKQE